MRALGRGSKNRISLGNAGGSVLHTEEVDDADVHLAKKALHRSQATEECQQIRAFCILLAMATGMTMARMIPTLVAACTLKAFKIGVAKKNQAGMAVVR